MERSRIKNIKKNGGQAMITSVVFFLFLSLTVIAGLVSPTVRDYTSGRLNFNSKRVYYLTESGSEDYLYRIFNSVTVATTESLTIDGNSVSTTLHSDTEDLHIQSDGSMQSLDRKLKVSLSDTQEASFNYGLQVGEGGVTLESSDIIGNVFSNGPIYGDTASNITGTAISATNNTYTEIAGNGSGTPAFEVNFGNINLEQDVAQSFQVNSSSAVSKIQVYLKRSNGIAPLPDITVNITDNNGNMPSSTVLATGFLPATSVTTDYSWVEVTLNTQPTLMPLRTYWLVLDVAYGTVQSANGYYIIGSTATISPYAIGTGWIGRFSDYWSTMFDFDYHFKIFTTGATGLIAGTSGSQYNPLRVGTVSGTAQAHTVNYVNVTGTLYCQTGTGNNKSCTSQPDPAPESFPIPDSYIAGWKAEAEHGGVYNGDYSVGAAGASLGPQKINGNLTISGGGTLTVNGTLWVTGNITLSGRGNIVLSPSYGSDDGLVLSDGEISIGSGSSVSGSGQPESYIMLLTTSSSGSAINIYGGSGAVILYAAEGTLNISGGATVKSATAYRIVVSGGSDLVYESGLAHVGFSSGGAVAQMIAISDWNEVE